MFLKNPHSVSTLRAALELKAVFDQIQAAETAGNLSPEEKKRLEDQAAEKGIQALFKVRTFLAWRGNIDVNACFQGTKLEVESVLRETCDRVLGDPSIPREKAHLRAVALQMLGQAYTSVRKEQDEAKEEAEYVRVETKNSRERASRPQ